MVLLVTSSEPFSIFKNQVNVNNIIPLFRNKHETNYDVKCKSVKMNYKTNSGDFYFLAILFRINLILISLTANIVDRLLVVIYEKIVQNFQVRK